MKAKVNHLLEILHSGMNAVRPAVLFSGLFQKPPTPLKEWTDASHRYLLCLGKASIDSAKAVLEHANCQEHFVLSPYPDGHHLNIHLGSHPIPNENSFRASQELLQWLASIPDGANLLVVLSGGTSALLVSPVTGLSLDAKMLINEMLIRSGASIQEINTVRKHLSAVKGGQLARHVSGKKCLVLVISDVIGDDLASIGSGPLYPDPSTFLDARQILEHYGLWKDCPEDVKLILEKGTQGQIPETPKSPLEIPHFIIASNEIACQAAAARAGQLGYQVDLWPESVSGSAKDAAASFAQSLDRCLPKTVLIAGGEITLQVRGNGIGGRNQHLVLLMTQKLAGKKALFGAAGTDGMDGNSQAAGAWTDGETFQRGSGEQSFRKAEENCDSHSYFKKIGQTIETGPTGTNVMDLYVGLT